MSPTRPAECMRACVGDAAATVLRPPCRSLPGRVGLGAPMVDTRTSRVSCHLGRRASCRQVGAGGTPGRGTHRGHGAVGRGSSCSWLDGAGPTQDCSTRSCREAFEPLNKMGVRAGRIRPFFQICCQSHGGAHHCGLGAYGASSLLCLAARQKAPL